MKSFKRVLTSVLKPNKDSLRNLINNLTVRYVAALCTISLLVSASPLLVVNVLEQQEFYRRFIVKASMFSDLSKGLSQLSVFYELDPDPESSADTYINISNQIGSLRKAWLDLLQDVPRLELLEKSQREFSENVIQIENNLKPFLFDVERQLQLRKDKTAVFPAELIRKIIEEERSLYNATRDCVQILEKSLSARVEKFKQIEWIFTAIILAVVALQGLFILRPSVQKVRNTLRNLKLSESLLQEAKQEAVEALRIRSEFVTKISHEVRNPLNAILGMSELLLETQLDFAQHRYAEISLRAGQSILDLINDFLDFSRLESGKLELEHIEYNVAEIVERAMDLVSSRAEEKGLELHLDFDWQLPATLWGDPKRIQQILVNLLGNAIKFTLQGEIRLQVKRPIFAGEAQLAFVVSDTGIGIQPERQSRIFESFVQVDPSINRKFGGTGLGLAICRDLVKMMKGTITLKSQINKGSVFYVYLPLEAATPHSFLQRFKELSEVKIEIGIIDHGEKRKKRLFDFLTLCGIKTTCLPLDFSVQDLKKYDLLLVDQEFLYSINWKTEELSGVQKIVWISQLKDLYQISSFFGSNPRFTCIPKPIKLTHLAEMISEMNFKVIQPVYPPLKPELEKRALQARILVLEDSEDNRMVLSLYLKGTPVDVVFGVNGREGLEKFKQGEFDMVFMDIEMPEMDGFEATRAMRAFESAHGRAPVPIIALTAYGHRDEIQKCLDAGCSQHLTKPIRKATFLNVVRQGVENKSSFGKTEALSSRIRVVESESSRDRIEIAH